MGSLSRIWGIIVLVGLGAIRFSLYPIVSILESGTSSSGCPTGRHTTLTWNCSRPSGG
ncbi:DUF2776 family protein [Streptomyces sp. NPDC058463]|uniref:DUF2776 family protein n=1 Tax=Streptomyces sp. NPDC058463 TaxID=3346510 RepID=UPI00364CAC07